MNYLTYRNRKCRVPFPLYFDSIFLIHHNLRLPFLILDGSGYANRFTIQVIFLLAGEVIALVEHDHGREGIIRILTAHIQKGR